MKHLSSHASRIVFLLVLSFSILNDAQAQTAPVAQALPYTQDFSSLLSTSTTYPAGWQGWTLAAASSGSFRTTAPTGNSNLTASSTAATTAGGVHNYNGKIGILASGSIDPSLCLAINTTNYANVQVSMDVMTIRNPGTRINGVDLQYNVGGIAGTWTTVSGLANGIYQNNTTIQTTAVTTPQNSITMSYALPAACNNQSAVYLRWVQRDISGSGSRSSFAVDNISICSSSVTPSIAIALTGGTNPACAGASLSFTATPVNQGSTPTYQWKVNASGVGTNSPSFTSSSLVNGDVVSCELVSSLPCATPSPALSNTITLTVNPNPVATCSVLSNVNCFGGSSGSIQVSATGGTLPYSGVGTFTGLSAGPYSYTVTDNNGCFSTCSSTLTEPSAPLSGFTFVINDANCFSVGDGRIGSNVSNAVGTVHYSWSPSGGTGPQATGLLAGTYTVTVSDDCSSFTSSQTITGPSVPLTISCVHGSDVTCYGGNDGSASVNVYNSVGLVGYTWSPSGGSGPSASGLTAGTYTVTVSDYCATPATCTVLISQPTSALSVNCSSTNESAPGAADGSASVSTIGGSSGPLSYSWSPSGGSGPTATGLSAGVYTVTVTDGSCGTSTCSSTVGTNCVPSTDPSSASAGASEICAGNNVSLSVSGGSLGTGAFWVWYEGGCGTGIALGTGSTFTTGALTVPGTHNFFVRAEGLCGTTSCVSVSVTVTPSVPLGSITIPVATAPVVGCVGGTTSISCSAVAGATGYSWSGPTGVLFNGFPSPYISTSTTVTLTYTALPPAGISGWNICVFAKNACGNSPNVKCHWIRASLSTPILSGSSTACAGSNEVYIVGPVDGAASYTWTITGAASLNGSGTTVTTVGPSVTASFAAGFSGGTICVYASTSCGTNSGSRCISISTAPVIPGAISGPSSLCPGSGSTYSISAVPGAVSYIWSASGTGLSVIGSGTSATVASTSGFTSGSICVIAVSSCGSPQGNSVQRCKTIGSGRLGTPGNITGDPSAGVCGQTYSYTIPSMPGATAGYTWTLPAGANGSSTSNSITVTFPSVFSSGTLCVHGNNSCGGGPDRCITVYGNPSTPSSLSGNQTPCAGTDEIYNWPSVPGASIYQLVVPVGYTVLSGNPTVSNFAIINVTASSGSIGVKALNSCGTSGTRTLALSPVSCRMSGNLPETAAALSTRIYPNPSTGTLNVQFNIDQSGASYLVELLDLSGRVVQQTEGVASSGSNLQTLDLTLVAKGLYLLRLQTPVGSETARIVIE